MKSRSLHLVPLAVSFGLLWLGGCGGGEESATSKPANSGAAASSASAPEPEAASSASAPESPLGGLAGPLDDGREMPEFEPESYDLEIPMVTYAWDPQAGDASVSAEDGGPGFTGEGWESNFTFPALGSAEAVKGGRITMHITS